MFSNLFDALRNRRNGKSPQNEEETMSNALSVEIRVKVPPSAPQELGPALQQAIQDAVLRTVQEQMMPRSPFSSPFGDEDDEGIDLGPILAMAAAAARMRDDSNENAPYGMPDLSDVLLSMRERMNPNGKDKEPTLLERLVQKIIDDYFDEDYSIPFGTTAFAALAIVRGEYEALSAPEISQEDVEKALELIGQFEQGVEHCCGLFICPDEIVLQVLKTYTEQSITPEEVAAD